MSWQSSERDGGSWRRAGRPGGDWQGLRPSLENPMTWSIPLGRIGGIEIRVHILFALFAIVILLRTLVPPGDDDSLTRLSFPLAAAAIGCLLVLVLVHEFGHCLACRWTGGDADEVLLWPLGGLAFCRPPTTWKSHLLTALGGPAVNLVFCVVSGFMLGVATGHWLGVAIPNPFQPIDDALRTYDLTGSWGLIALYLVNWVSFVVLLLNLVPMFPLDGGRILQAVLWRKRGYVESMRTTVRVGYLWALVIGLAGAVLGNWWLLGVAVFGGVTCFLTNKQLEFTEETLGGTAVAEEHALELLQEDDEETARQRQLAEERRAERVARKAEEEAKRLDEVLSKIASEGMDSLTRTERRLLQRMTEQKRRDEE